MPNIKVKLTATNVQTSTSSFYDDSLPASHHPVLSTNGPPPNGAPMVVALPVGSYALLCAVMGTPGPFGPLTVTDMNDVPIGTNVVPAEIGPDGRGHTIARFVVMPGATAGAAKLKTKPKNSGNRRGGV